MHREVIELVSEHNASDLYGSQTRKAKHIGGTHIIERPILCPGNEGLVVGINLGRGNVSRLFLPVEGVILPDDGTETESLSDGTNTVINVSKGRLKEG